MNQEELLKNLSEIKTDTELLELLELQPPKEWIKQHAEISNYIYLPIEKVELLLRTIFKLNYKIEVLSTSEILGATSVTVRVWYKTFDTKEWQFFDGTGADTPNFEQVGVSPLYAVSASLPNAKTNAIKDACDHFGNLFGCNLSRNQNSTKTKKITSDEKLINIKLLSSELSAYIDSEDGLYIERVIEFKEVDEYDEVLNQLEILKKKVKPKK